MSVAVQRRMGAFYAEEERRMREAQKRDCSLPYPSIK